MWKVVVRSAGKRGVKKMIKLLNKIKHELILIWLWATGMPSCIDDRAMDSVALQAAAPDLLEACKLYLSIPGMVKYEPVEDAIRKAVAKAESK